MFTLGATKSGIAQINLVDLGEVPFALIFFVDDYSV